MKASCSQPSRGRLVLPYGYMESDMLQLQAQLALSDVTGPLKHIISPPVCEEQHLFLANKLFAHLLLLRRYYSVYLAWSGVCLDVDLCGQSLFV